MLPLQYPIYHPEGPKKLTPWQGTLVILLHKMLIKCLVRLGETPYAKRYLLSPKWGTMKTCAVSREWNVGWVLSFSALTGLLS